MEKTDCMARGGSMETEGIMTRGESNVQNKMAKKPVIGIAGNILIMDEGMFPGLIRDYVNRDYVTSVRKAGGVPLIMTALDEEEIVHAQVERVDGIILSGGWDLEPQLYGEEPMWQQGFTLPEVDYFYLKVIKAAIEMGKPILGICKGIQAINVAFGGTLYQDIPTQMENTVKHNQSAPREYGTHTVKIEKDSFLGECLPETTQINSFHHQSIKKLAEGFKVTARAKDGVIEAIERTEGNLVTAVQWHPEMMASYGNAEMLGLFEHFIKKVRIQ